MEKVDSIKELKSSRVCGKDFPNFEMLDAKIVSALKKIIQNSQFKKKVSLEEQKAQKEDGFLRGRQTVFMIYDYFRGTDAHDTVSDYADVFSVTLHDDNVQEFDARWDEVLLSVSKIPSDDILESLYKLRIRESAQLKTVLELYDMEIHQMISMSKYQKLETMVKRSKNQKLRLRNFDAMGKLNQEPWSRVERDQSALKEEKVPVTSGKKKASVRKETDAVSGTEPKTVHKNHNTLSPRLLSQPLRKVEVCRRREVSEAKVTMGPFFDNRADII